MGDHTTVTLYVPSALKVQAESLFDYAAAEAGEDPGDGLAYFVFDEVNYGNLEFLNLLGEAGIAYDSCWDSGDQHGAGSTCLRFDSEGNALYKDISDNNSNPCIVTLLSLIDDHKKLKEFILKHQEEQSEMPWDNQVEYGKIFLAKKLIS